MRLAPSPTSKRSSASSRRGLAASHVLLLVGVATLLFTLTLTRLQLFAVYENERDAVALLERMGRRLDAEHVLSTSPATTVTSEPAPNLRDVVEAAKLSVGNPADAVWLQDGNLLRRRGYLFELSTSASGERFLRAWPWRVGSTGEAAYAFTRKFGLLGHVNRSGSSGVSRSRAVPLWSGPGAAPQLGLGDGEEAWIVLEDSRALALASRMP
ncbi:hypothetical protein Pla163_20930 [Planctomycetes bacterium Pla163]|uniref:Uncharacterized protein n=1 Tax=Rohdeia mirabilis TaxID=2528008 RepID=A0A518D0I9_9BACT|nr:hypothetical protein Pla163_20930 [Planctomycetes bacterium Pla163]